MDNYQQIGNQNILEKTITAKTKPEVREKLFNLYGMNYKITDIKPVFHGGFLGFFQHCEYVAKYVVNNTQTEQEESFQEAQKKILEKTNFDSSKLVKQLNKNIESQFEMLNKKIANLSQASETAKKHPSIAKIESILRDNEFTYSYINNITTRLQDLSIAELDDYDNVRKTVMQWIGESIKIFAHEPRRMPHVVILVGPTGVGKTTTIAKLACLMIKEAKDKNLPPPKIRMITIDNTRVGAVEQLKRFGDLMNIDVDRADTADDIKKIYDMYKDSLDALFIDTPGYSPNDYENIGKMRGLLKNDLGMNPDVFLTVMASVKAKDLVSIMSHYETFEFGSVIITKWDETSAIGNVLSVLSEKGKEVSYIADGQKVLGMISKATVGRFLKNLSDFNIEHKDIDELFPGDN